MTKFPSYIDCYAEEAKPEDSVYEGCGCERGYQSRYYAQGASRTMTTHVNVWSQSLDSGVSVSYKGCRKAPRYCHELEIAFSNGDAVSFWAADPKQLRDMAKLILEVAESIVHE